MIIILYKLLIAILKHNVYTFIAIGLWIFININLFRRIIHLRCCCIQLTNLLLSQVFHYKIVFNAFHRIFIADLRHWWRNVLGGRSVRSLSFAEVYLLSWIQLWACSIVFYCFYEVFVFNTYQFAGCLFFQIHGSRKFKFWTYSAFWNLFLNFSLSWRRQFHSLWTQNLKLPWTWHL